MAPPKKYPQVVKTLIDEIRYGTYPVGGEFPNLDIIARTYGISRVTAFRVLSTLVEEGYIPAGRGRKSTVIAREKPSLYHDALSFKNIALVADFNLSGSSEITLKMVYSIQNELKEGGHHVSCLQYHNGQL